MARLPRVVVDASVACKWFVPESRPEGALRLREALSEGQLLVLAPALMPYELANALRYHPSMTRERLRLAIRSLFDLQVALIHPSSAALREAAEFAYAKKLTIYDACYAMLSEAHSCDLVTDDTRLLRASGRAIPSHEWSLDR